MDSAKLDELEKAAKAATPGPWTTGGLMEGWLITPLDNEAAPIADCETKSDQLYIVAASPDAILELIHKYRVAERALEIAADYWKDAAFFLDKWRAQADRELGEK